jgi:pyrophosphate--fructose-6-phosphate 1-phosphotransferase
MSIIKYQVSQISTEQLLIQLAETELAGRRQRGEYSGPPFEARAHFLGYEGRCSLPSNFDATYCTALGHTAAALVGNLV